MESKQPLTSRAKLIKAEINLLGAQYIGDGRVAVSYEFPYRAKYGERRWAKQVISSDASLLNDDRLCTSIYTIVQALRAELEQ